MTRPPTVFSGVGGFRSGLLEQLTFPEGPAMAERLSTLYALRMMFLPPAYPRSLDIARFQVTIHEAIRVLEAKSGGASPP